MHEPSGLLEIVALLYDSVLDESKWSQALQSLARFSSGHAAGHVVANPRLGTIIECETVNVDPSFKSKYLNYYATKEVRLAPALAFPVGSVLTEPMLIDQRSLERSEIYADLLLPTEVPHFMFAWLQKTPDAVQCIAIEGTQAHGAFGQPERERFSLLVPHLIRAARMRDLLAVARRHRRIHLNCLKALPFGIIFLDETGKVLESTAAAERLLAQADGIRQAEHRVHATQAQSDGRLQQAIRNALDARHGQTIPGDNVLLRRPRKESLSVSVVPIGSGDHMLMSARVSVMLLIIDPTDSSKPPARAVQRHFGLTEAEAALANTLYSGVTLREAADVLHISINTCKTQLKSIYAKVNCTSHAQLVKVMTACMMSEVIKAQRSVEVVTS